MPSFHGFESEWSSPAHLPRKGRDDHAVGVVLSPPPAAPTAPYTAPPRPSVAREFVRKATSLRDKIVAADSLFQYFLMEIIGPYRPRQLASGGFFTPTPRKKVLLLLGREWETITEPARLKGSFHSTKSSFAVAEMRAGPCTLDAPGWSEPELGIRLFLYILELAPGKYLEEQTTIASLGLHALSRYYQRAWDASDAQILEELCHLAVAASTLSAHDQRFLLQGAQGAWAGRRLANGEAAIRTFLPEREAGS
jgi:hypothetical protein